MLDLHFNLCAGVRHERLARPRYNHLKERRDPGGLHRVKKTVRGLGLKPGDVVSVEPGKADPIVVHRALECDLLTLSEVIYNTNALVRVDPLEQVVVNLAQLDEPEPRRRRLNLVRGDMP